MGRVMKLFIISTSRMKRVLKEMLFSTDLHSVHKFPLAYYTTIHIQEANVFITAVGCLVQLRFLQPVLVPCRSDSDLL